MESIATSRQHSKTFWHFETCFVTEVTRSCCAMNSKHIACLKIKFFKCHLKFIFLDKKTGYTDCTANALCNIELYRDSWPISSQVGRASVIETLDLGSIPYRVKKKTIELVIHSFLAWRSTWKRDRVKPSPCVQDRCARYSLTRRLKSPFTVFWPTQLSKWSSYNYFFTTVNGTVDNKIQVEVSTVPICIYNNTTWKFSTGNQSGLASLLLFGCTNFGQMSLMFIKSSKKLPSHLTKTHVKFESHRISFDGGSFPIKGF